MPIKNRSAFTVLELLLVLTIIGVFSIALYSRLAKVSEEAGVTTALEEMNNIKKAVVDLFYPDLGFVPEDPGEDGMLISEDNPSAAADDRPWFATRYLCLKDDRAGTGQTPDPQTSPESYEMWMFLRSQINRENPDDAGALSMAKAKLSWDRYRQKGWRGPYMEQDLIARLDAADATAMPLVATPWAEKCEELAQQAEEAGDGAEAETLRRGKYYLIVSENELDDEGQYSSAKNTARIICFGADCEDGGSYLKSDAQTGEAAPATVEDFRKANVNDPSDPECYYTEDDIVVFIFGGGAVRRPSN
jgi:prepilin-type N-terminal cleavage/methylation domain-containing protein